jgi:hypothetical protein
MPDNSSAEKHQGPSTRCTRLRLIPTLRMTKFFLRGVHGTSRLVPLRNQNRTG